MSPAPTQETRCFDALAEMYAELGEEDVMFGLWKRRCVTEDTRLALGQLQHGYLEDAQSTLLDALAKDWRAGELLSAAIGL